MRSSGVIRATLVALTLALTCGAGCAETKYLTFEVWEAPGQTSHAKKFFNLGFGYGSYFDEVWELLKKNDVDGAIRRIEAEPKKTEFDYYNLAILYEVKHDWAKAEENINLALSASKGPNDDLKAELAYIQEHRARYVAGPAAPAPAAVPTVTPPAAAK